MTRDRENCPNSHLRNSSDQPEAAARPLVRWANPSAGCNMRNVFLTFLALLASAPLGIAQQPNPYAQAQANGYAQAAASGVQPVQYPYGYYGSSAAPAFAYPPQSGYAPNYGYNTGYPIGYNNGYGVNYYYVQNPYANPGPYRPAGAAPAPAPAATTSWPQPVQNLPPLPTQEEVAGIPLEGDPLGQTHAPVAGISFRRPTADCFWFDPSYTATFMRPMHMNGPLVTTGSVNDPIPGALNQPGTLVLFGQNTVDFGLFSGARAELGIFLDRENHFSLDVTGFYLVQNTSSFFIGADPNGNPLIARPYFNVADGFNQQYRFVNSQQGLLTGTFAVDMRSQMAGLEFNAAFHSYIQDRYHAELLGGFRYLRLSESLQTSEQVNALNGTTIPFAGSTFNPPDFVTDQDNFTTLNQFYGPQVGARLSWEERWFTLDAFAKLALGANVERTDINGSTTLITPGQAAQTANGGVLAVPSNSGSFSRSVFDVVPECGFDLSVNITQNIRVKFGYSFLYWSHVVRPGSQYSTDINPGQVNSSFFFGQTTGPNAPVHRFNEEVFWTNSFNLGLEVHF